MTATRVLQRIVDDTVELPAISSEFEVVPDRCAVECVVSVLGVALWRVRLRTIAVRLRLGVVGADLGAAPGSLTVHVSVKPQFASLPGTLGWFLPAVPRDARIDIVVPEFPAVTEPGIVEVDAKITVADYSWLVPLVFRFVTVEDECLVAAISGVIPRTPRTPFDKIPMRIDAAMELRRCD